MTKWLEESECEDFEKELREKGEEESTSGEEFRKVFHKYSKPFDVDYTLRFLPAVKDKHPGRFIRPFYRHVFQNTDEDWVFITCPWTYGDKKCPVCRIVSKLYASSESQDRKIAKKMRRSTWYVANAYVVEDPTDKGKDDEEQRSEGKVKLFPFKKQINEVISSGCDGNAADGLGVKAVLDPEEGYDFILKVRENRTEDAVFPSYRQSNFARKPRPIADTDKEIKAVLEQVYSLDDYLEEIKMSKTRMLEIMEEEGLIDYLEKQEIDSLGIEPEESNPLEDDVPMFDEEAKESKSEEKEMPKSKSKSERKETKKEGTKKESSGDSEDDEFMKELADLEDSFKD